MGLYRLAIHLDAAGGELHPDGALALQVELISRETGQQVALPYSRVSDEHDYIQNTRREHIKIADYFSWFSQIFKKKTFTEQLTDII